MKALVLSAGEGTRLGELTRQKPKALVRLAGVPLLGRVLHNLREAGVHEVCIVIGFRGDEIREEISGDYAGLKVHYIENPDYEKGNLYSLHAARGFFERDNFLLCMTDHLFDTRIVEKLIDWRLEGALALAIDRGRRYSAEATKVLEQDGKIGDIGKSIKKMELHRHGVLLVLTKSLRILQRGFEAG
ncbi:MAG: NTP transferase domain-containing protein [Candidatus Geothermarchaeales archaeon]